LRLGRLSCVQIYYWQGSVVNVSLLYTEPIAATNHTHKSIKSRRRYHIHPNVQNEADTKGPHRKAHRCLPLPLYTIRTPHAPPLFSVCYLLHHPLPSHSTLLVPPATWMSQYRMFCDPVIVSSPEFTPCPGITNPWAKRDYYIAILLTQSCNLSSQPLPGFVPTSLLDL
jgi:hypothetical protein